MKKPFILIVTAIVITLSSVCLFYVWPLDFFGSKKIVTQATTSSGHNFAIAQWWNRVDFYSVELQHISPEGAKYSCIVVADTPKWWSCNMHFTSNANQVEITHNGKNVGIYDWQMKILRRPNGVSVTAR